jgi:hypothetical protein
LITIGSFMLGTNQDLCTIPLNALTIIAQANESAAPIIVLPTEANCGSLIGENGPPGNRTDERVFGFSGMTRPRTTSA